jgi:hypothetical protein
MLLMSLACDAIALGSNQVEVEVPPFFMYIDNLLKFIMKRAYWELFNLIFLVSHQLNIFAYNGNIYFSKKSLKIS